MLMCGAINECCMYAGNILQNFSLTFLISCDSEIPQASSGPRGSQIFHFAEEMSYYEILGLCHLC